MAQLQKFHYHVAEDRQVGPGAMARSPQSFGAERVGGHEPAGRAGPAAPSFTSDEAAARYFLDELLQRDDRAALRAVVEPDRPQRVPGLVVESERDLKPLGTHQVRFTQTYHHIPIFGSAAVVELTPARELVSVSAELDEVSGVDPIETLGRRQALERVARYTGATFPPDTGADGRLMFYKDPEDAVWHLAWFLPALPAEPPATPSGRGHGPGVNGRRESELPAVEGHGFGRRPVPASYNFLVDAHDGEILFAYSAVPTALATPARCTGTDEDEVEQSFLGRLTGAGGTEVVLDDPLRSVRTYDLEFADLDTDPPLPGSPVRAASSDFGTANRAAVSAHLNAARVQDFYKGVLQRNGIDDLGMALVSLVNATAASMETPPTLLNAFWWQQRMWYGQIKRDGRLVSLSRYLDVIAHELTHGVIESTSNLVYATQSGALNESFADVAGVIINNWYNAPDRADVRTWTWEIGPGLRTDGRPLRDFANPERLGHPAHMKDFVQLSPGEQPHSGNDNGWVHYNSNIHNKAVHNLLTMSNGDGAPVFTVEDVTILTYLGMARLTPLATFTAALEAVVDVARTYFGGDAARDAKIAAIREAYRLVGIG
ncbi:M4 family metallopeptidase [Catellatospora sp. NPDC049609]|uniref:M4 family metallopeptidase n=1 Tax=Catellatospora sp. NPDC049609 TaxID=3155505 RepID=UPI003430C05A